MTSHPVGSGCPRCGCALLWNGRALSCIACSYLSADVKSEKRIPSAGSRKKERRRTGSSGS